MARGQINAFLQFIYKRGFRLNSLAKASGVALGTLGMISSGHRKMTPEIRTKLAAALGCSERSIPNPLVNGVEDGGAARGVVQGQ